MRVAFLCRSNSLMDDKAVFFVVCVVKSAFLMVTMRFCISEYKTFDKVYGKINMKLGHLRPKS